MYRFFKKFGILLLLQLIQFLMPQYYPYYVLETSKNYVGHLESKELLRIQPAQLFNFS